MGAIGAPVREYDVPEPVKAPVFDPPKKIPMPEFPVKEPVKVAVKHES